MSKNTNGFNLNYINTDFFKEVLEGKLIVVSDKNETIQKQYLRNSFFHGELERFHEYDLFGIKYSGEGEMDLNKFDEVFPEGIYLCQDTEEKQCLMFRWKDPFKHDKYLTLVGYVDDLETIKYMMDCFDNRVGSV